MDKVMINDYFDAIYCINLEKRRDRWFQAQEEFLKHKMVVDRFKGIFPPQYIGIANGALGCLLSHDFLIEKAMDERLSNILIFEDDVVFDDDFVAKFEKWYPQVPKDWDMLYLGGNHNGLKVDKISENVGRVTDMFATHAYAIKETIFEEIITALSDRTQQVDVHYAKIQKKCNAYCFIPLLAFQREGYSDVMNENKNYDFELKFNHNKPLV
jgi:GR25 family glycosyltransferase involved in LPS biosynthesis